MLCQLYSIYQLHHLLIDALVWGAVRKNIISDGFSTKNAISADILLSLRRDSYLSAERAKCA